MRILHDGAETSPSGINGVNATVWLMAIEQRRLGHEVGLLFRRPATQQAREIAAAHGIHLIAPQNDGWLGSETRLRNAFGRRELPSIVHMHSVFIPSQAILARELVRCGIPYVVTPHGGLSSEILRRGKLKKSMYVRLVERPRCAAAAALTASFGEEREIRRFMANANTPIRRLPVPVSGDQLGSGTWTGDTSSRKLVFLGRFDVYVKGIDRLINLAGLMRDHEFHLYGAEDPKTRNWLDDLRVWSPPNVFFHAPVFGVDKVRVLTEASMYIQLSRSESFGISIAEAMYLGVPCAISNEINLARSFLRHDLGLTLPSSSGFAAHQLTLALRSPETLHRWSQRAREFGRTHFDATSAVGRYVQLYQEVLGGIDGDHQQSEEEAEMAAAV